MLTSLVAEKASGSTAAQYLAQERGLGWWKHRAWDAGAQAEHHLMAKSNPVKETKIAPNIRRCLRVHQFCFSTLQFLTHCISTGWHAVAFARLGRIAADAAVHFPSIDFNVRSALLYGSVNLSPDLRSKILGRRHLSPLGFKDAVSEEYKDLFDVSCPKCSKMLLVVPYPTIQQTREAAAAGNLEAIAALPSVLTCEERWEQFEHIKLKSPDQLPDLEEEPLHLTWDSEVGDPDNNIVIKLGERVLWREPEWYECWPRFNEIKDILKAKYGHRFFSLTPTEASEFLRLPNCEASGCQHRKLPGGKQPEEYG